MGAQGTSILAENVPVVWRIPANTVCVMLIMDKHG
jgi:hypothetical protein